MVIEATASLLPSFMSRTPWVVRPILEICRAENRIAIPLVFMSITVSSSAIIPAATISRTGDIVAAGMIAEEDTVMLMNTSGIAIRFSARQISRIGRTTQGVRLMKLGNNEAVASMTIIEPKDPASEARLAGLEESEIGTEGAEP